MRCASSNDLTIVAATTHSIDRVEEVTECAGKDQGRDLAVLHVWRQVRRRPRLGQGEAKGDCLATIQASS